MAAKSAIKGKVKTNSPTANFISLIAGMITSLLLATISYAYFTSEPEPLDRGDRLVDTEETLVEDGVTHFEELMKGNSARDVYRTVMSISNLKLASRPGPAAIDILTKQAKLADRLLELSTDELHIAEAIKAKIRSAQIIYGVDAQANLGMETVALNLKRAAEPYINDSDPEIAKMAQMAMCKLHVFEFAKNMTDTNLKYARNSMLFLIENYENDSAVLDTVNLLLDQNLASAPEETLDLVTEMDRRMGHVESIARMTDGVRDKAIMATYGFDQLVANYWANGEQGRADLRSNTLQLIQRDDIGPVAIRKVRLIMDWLEKNREADLAREFAMAIIDRANKYKSEECTQLAQTFGRNVIRRTDLVGQPFSASGKFILDTEEVDADFESDIQVIVFWDPEANRPQFPINAAKIVNEKESANVKLVMVVMNPEDRDSVVTLSSQARRWHFTTNDNSIGPENSLSDRYPVSLGPHILVINRRGNIQRANLPLNELANTLEEARARF